MNKNLKFKIKNLPGYTLMEVLIAVSIFAMVLGMVVAIFTTNSRIQAKTQAVRETSQTLRYIMEAIGREVQLADGCVETNGNGSYFKNPPILNENNQLTLARTAKEKQTDGSEITVCIVHQYNYDSSAGILSVNVGKGTFSGAGVNVIISSINFDSAIKLNDFNQDNSLGVKITSFLVSPDYLVSFYTNLTSPPTANVISQQPSVQIKLIGEYNQGIKQAEKSTQTLETAFTTRNYPGFNDISQ
ncbi:MAG: prepilin-type N-terminal cleavage/methylation domain-containing protein [Patescibacteria group bacterium]|nr:prepilin-type N-terminal cleavage/methylation domain-containing protein [Patescibacteria group bacterium]